MYPEKDKVNQKGKTIS